ncbi:hypothetical protein [Wolbachia endosymbiont (group E) of Neria commutata]|uniref:hypothetical protein n=1 Tax=Wolbachia endosymbiont (group E) of Neria commutata TaxID=3066149 RepID=UPI0031332A21
MRSEKERLAGRREVRADLKFVVTTLSTAFLAGYIAALVIGISDFDLHFAIAGTILSAASLALNIWSLADHFLKRDANKKIGIEGTPEQKKKLTKIYLDIASSISFLAGGVASLACNPATLSLHEASIIFFVSTSFFILGCAIMAVNIIRRCADSKPQTQEDYVSVAKVKDPAIGR